MRIDWRRLSALVTILLTLVALGIVIHAIDKISWPKVLASLDHVGLVRFAWSLLFTAASYLTLTGFDWLGIAHLGRRLSYRRVALTSFLSLSIGHTVGLAPLSSGAIRFRYYSEAGLNASQVASVIALSAVTVALGETTLCGVALLWQPALGGRLLHVDRNLAGLIGAACLAFPLLYLLMAWRCRRQIHCWRWSFSMPSIRIALGQVFLGLLNYGFVAAALYCVFASAGHARFAEVATAYVVGNLASLISHVPGGLGVLEMVIGALFPGADSVGPLISFRIAYFLIPLFLGCLAFAATELLAWLRPAKPQFRP